jgi:hypothetical protein
MTKILPPGSLFRCEDEQIILALKDIPNRKTILLAAFSSSKCQQQKRLTHPFMEWGTQPQREEDIQHLHDELRL